ncbi:MAG: carboxypeptidase-like regulatory domain-containing protein [Enhygromyxa sp.]
MSARTLLLLAIVALGACGEDRKAASGDREPVVIEVPAEPPRADSPAPNEPPPSAPLEPVEVTPLPGAEVPGPVYLAIDTKGVVKLDQDGATLVLDRPERNIEDLFVGPDGAAYLLDARSLRKLDGERVSEVARFGSSEVAPVVELALAPNGGIWATGSRGVGHYHDGRWTLSSREQLGLGFNTSLAVALDGTVWLAGSTKLLRRPAAGDEWELVEVSALGRVPLLLDLSTSPSGAVLATNGKQLIRLAGEQPELIPLAGAERIAYTAGLSIAADGSLALASGGCELLRLGPDGRGEAWRFAGEGYACESLEAMAIDARRRIWVASREGLSVIDEGGQVVEYPAGSFAALAGRVSHMVALGRGPELPEAGELATASLIGQFMLDETPLAKVELEVCPSVRLRREGSPCSAARLRFETRTDAQGKFRLDGVPIGDYSFAVEVEGAWRWTSPPSFAAELRPGQTHDLGILVLAKA